MRSSATTRLGRAAALVWFAAAASAALAQSFPTPGELFKTRASTEARRVVDWVLQGSDHAGLPFAVVDKRLARIHVFDGAGRLVGETAVLVGQTWGDHTVPGVGDRAQIGAVRADERTTPAGRFESQPGRNRDGEHVIWVDPASAFAIHRLRPGRSERTRSVRLATASPDDNRASLGCVVVPVRFYQEVIEPTLGRTRSVVYVLPEAGPLQLPFADASGV
jgi:hypothetical protein